jgi:hypothetical protein
VIHSSVMEHPKTKRVATLIPQRAKAESIRLTIDNDPDTGNRARGQLYPVRQLVSGYSASAVFATIIATELGTGGGV